MLDKNNKYTYTREDRDLLIELRTEMRVLRQDVNKFNNDTVVRIADLEKYKLDVDAWRDKNKDVLEITNKHEEDIEDFKTFKDTLTGKMTIIGAGSSIVVSLLFIGIQYFLNK